MKPTVKLFKSEMLYVVRLANDESIYHVHIVDNHASMRRWWAEDAFTGKVGTDKTKQTKIKELIPIE